MTQIRRRKMSPKRYDTQFFFIFSYFKKRKPFEDLDWYFEILNLIVFFLLIITIFNKFQNVCVALYKLRQPLVQGQHRANIPSLGDLVAQNAGTPLFVTFIKNIFDFREVLQIILDLLCLVRVVFVFVCQIVAKVVALII